MKAKIIDALKTIWFYFGRLLAAWDAVCATKLDELVDIDEMGETIKKRRKTFTYREEHDLL